MTVKVAKCLDEEGVRMRDEAEQKMIEASIKGKITGEQGAGSVAPTPLVANNNSESYAGGRFGSNLDADLKTRSRSRTLSTSSSGVIAMSPDERRAIEEEMRSQRFHPLVRDMSLEADRIRERHDLEYREMARYRNRDMSRDAQRRLEELLHRRASAIVGNRERREFNQRLSIVTGIHESDDEESEVNERLDDLFMLEAALYLSMREREGLGSRSGGASGGERSSSRNRSSRSSSRSGSDHGDNNSGDNTISSRSQHRGSQRGSRLLRRERSGRRSPRDFRSNPHAIDPQNILHQLIRERGADDPSRNPYFRGTGLTDYPSTRDGLVMGLSEASQLEMAIQLSLQEAQQRNEAVDDQDASSDADQNGGEGEGAGGEVDHGEEEIIFEPILETADTGDPSPSAENENSNVLS